MKDKFIRRSLIFGISLLFMGTIMTPCLSDYLEEKNEIKHNFELPSVMASELVFSTLIGGTNWDASDLCDVAVDTNGYIYIIGTTSSADFPTTPSSYNTSLNGGRDVFVAKLSPAGNTLVYSTFIGGNNYDYGEGISVDVNGYVYLIGLTFSNDFPTTSGAYDTTYNGGGDVFVAKLSPMGDTLVYSTFIGGTGYDWCFSIVVDTNENAEITGQTDSSDFPTTLGAYDPVFSGGHYDGFVAKLTPAGDTLVYSTFIGGTDVEYCYDIAVDANDYVYVTGDTESSNFPTTPGSYDDSYNGHSDGFVAKLTPAGDTLVYSTFIGGTSFDDSIGITVDVEGFAYLTGRTASSDFPTTPGAYDTIFNGPGGDVFVIKLSPIGNAIVYGTFLGGIGEESPDDIVVNAYGYAYSTGTTSSNDFPTTSNAFDTTRNGNSDLFETVISTTGHRLKYSTFLGGNLNDTSDDIVIDEQGYSILYGKTNSIDFPTTPGAYDTTYNGNYDVFIAKFGQISQQPPNQPTITGLNRGKAGKEYEYKFLATDVDGDQIYYIIDWGDNTSELTLGPYASGYETIVMHSWNNEGTYIIKVKTRDAFDAESDWATLTVTMPCSYKPMPQFLDWLFQRFPNAFSLLRHLMGY